MRWSGRWAAMAATVLLVASPWRRADGQKIEKDSLDNDAYNLNQAKSNAEENIPFGKSKFIVTDEVYFDISIGGLRSNEDPEVGRIVIGCFGELLPITCLNFVSLAKGYRRGRQLLTYKDTPVHRIVKDFVIQMGDVSGQKGKGGASIYGEKFQDENFRLSHRGGGWVSMANYGRDTNGSQFFIMLQPARWLDGKHVVFGKVLRGMELVRRLGELDTYVSGKPKRSVTIVDCGVLEIEKKYEIPEAEIYNQNDMTMT